METLVTTLHFLVALLMIGLILIQQGKGAGMGVSMGGGASNTVFGSSGGATFFSKVTAFLALVFFVTSLGLALISRDNARIDTGTLLPSGQLETVAPAESADPVLPEEVPALPITEVPEASLTLPIESAVPQADDAEPAIPTE